MQRAKQVVEQIIRPTGLIDPEIIVRPATGQVDDLLGEIAPGRGRRRQRVLVTTLTKRMAESLTELSARVGDTRGISAFGRGHAGAHTADLRSLRLGEYDVLVGINLLREGLDLPGGRPWWRSWTRTRRASSAQKPA